MSIITDLNPEALAFKALAGIAAAVAIFTWGHHVGYTGEKATYDLYVANQAKIAAMQVANNKIALDNQKAQFDLDQQKMEQDHAKALENISSARDAAIADSANSAERLRKYLAHPSARTVVVSGPATGPGQPATVSQGAGELSDGVSDFNRWLIDEFSRADTNAATLNEAIDLIAKDRAVCNGSIPGVTPTKQ